jgi:hypothetical protein
MSKNITFGFIVMMALLLAGEAAGFQSRQRTPEQLKRQEEFQKNRQLRYTKPRLLMPRQFNSAC